MPRLKKDNVDVRKPRRFSRLKKLITATIAGLTLFSYLTAPAEARNVSTSNHNAPLWVRITAWQPAIAGNLRGWAEVRLRNGTSYGYRVRSRISNTNNTTTTGNWWRHESRNRLPIGTWDFSATTVGATRRGTARGDAQRQRTRGGSIENNVTASIRLN